VTIAIGFVCKDAVVLVSDSQMSTESKFKRFDERKVFPLRFADGTWALIAISGLLDSAARFREILEAKTELATVSHSRSIANTMEEALRETRSHFVSYISGEGVTDNEKAQHLELLHFEVLLAYYHDGKPYLYHSALHHGSAIPCRNTFEAIGCGTDVASFILTGCDMPNRDDGEALGLAFYAVEACKKFDKQCGGPFQHLVLKSGKGAVPGTFSSKLMAIYADAFWQSEAIIHRAIIDSIIDSAKRFEDGGIIEKDDSDKVEGT
jgi:20S proteasome alpha/beta subunit